MMQQVETNRAQVSALVDGQLQGEALDRALAAACQDADARLTWQAYHLVGEVLRTGEADVSQRDADFVARLKLKLHQPQPASSEENAMVSVAINPIHTRPGAINHPQGIAANDSLFRGWRVAGLASVLALGLAVLLSFQDGSGTTGSAQLSQAPVQVLPLPPEVAAAPATSDELPLMIRDSQLDALLAAHKQFGGTSALQGPTGFLRNATFEGASR
jgi:sigma-E factor negative regulatory protein RseA